MHPDDLTQTFVGQSVPTIPLALIADDLEPFLWIPSRTGVMSAWWGHVPFGHWLVSMIEPGTVVELGTHEGVSFSAFCEAILQRNIAGRCYAVDTWEGDEHAGRYDESVFQDLTAFNRAHYGAFAELMRMTFDQALDYFADGSIDLLHIDGLHLYEAVKREFGNWLPKLSARGVVLFHDTNVRERDFGVWKLWAELRQKYPSFEFLHGHGLGLIAVGPEIPHAVRALCDLSPTVANTLKQRVAQLGARWSAPDWVDRYEQHARNLEERSEQQDRSLADHVQHVSNLEGDRAHLKAEHARLVDETERLGREMEALRAEMAKQARTLAAQPLRAEQSEKMASALQGQLAELYASTSWRITSPLRAVKRIGRTLRSAITPAANGQAEGRAARSRVDTLDFPTDRLLRDRETVLVIVHEATRTGAAILAWNIVGKLQHRYNVIALLKQGGPIEQAFSDASCGAITLPGDFIIQDAETDALANRIGRVYAPKYVVANSVETRYFVPSLERAGIPTISLIHEFSSTVRPIGTLHPLIASGSQIVFSAQIVADSVLADYRDLEARFFKVMPQGASLLPPENKAAAPSANVANGGLALLPPDDGTILVVGIGTVTMRKGVEFFIAAAASVQRQSSSPRIKFVWVGAHYAYDQPYFDYLSEQIRRAGVESSFAFVGEFEELAPIYERADICFLSSRLDPLPNIAIDSAMHGIPVICFDQASGIAEILSASEDTRDLVVPYLDAEAAARLVVAMAKDPKRLSAFSDAMRAVAARHFDMTRYVAAIDELGREAMRAGEQAAQDLRVIAKSSLFNARLYLGASAATTTPERAIAKYLHASRLVAPRNRPRTGMLVRRPMEGFHPFIYAAENLDYNESSGEDPFAHYIRTGRPAGRWQHIVIRQPEQTPAKGSSLRVAIHGHFHYPDLLSPLLQRLDGNRTPFDLILTTTSDAAARELAKRVPGHATILVAPNRGRDIGAMLTGLSQDMLAKYDVVGHFHGKRSPHVDASIGETWLNFLLEHLVGGEHAMMDTIMAAFEADPALNLVFAEDPHLNDWDENRSLADGLAKRMGLPLPLPTHFDFPQGTMFWARPKALKPLMDLGLTWDDYPDEPLPTDGTLLHAIERLVPFSAAQGGNHYAMTHLAGSVR